MHFSLAHVTRITYVEGSIESCAWWKSLVAEPSAPEPHGPPPDRLAIDSGLIPAATSPLATRSKNGVGPPARLRAADASSVPCVSCNSSNIALLAFPGEAAPL